MDDTDSSGPPLRGLAVFMGAMTSAWSLNAAAAAPGVVTLLGVGLGVLVVVLALTVRPRPAPDETPTVRDADAVAAGVPALDASRLFRLAVAAEVAAGVVAVVLLARAGLTDYIQPVIALVVALHFPIFLIGQRFWLHLAAGLFGALGAGLAILLMATGTIGAESGRAIAGLSLATCTLAYGVAFVMALRRPVPGGGPDAGSGQRTAGRRVSA